MKEFDHRKIVIISGANGYFGHIAQTYFISQGWRVMRATRDVESDIFFDLNQPEQIASVHLNTQADLFIHAAAAHEVTCRQNPYESIFQNIAGTRAALDLCAKNAIPKFIYLSTFHVFGSPEGIIDETTFPIPNNDYGLTNLMAEKYVNLYNRRGLLDGVVIRPSNFFGIPEKINQCRRWTLTPLAFCREAVENKKIVLRTPGHQQRNFISIYDLCEVIRAIAESNENYPLLHVAGQDTLSIRELAQRVKSVMRTRLNQEIELVLPDGPQTEGSFTYTSRYLDKIYQPKLRIDQFIEEFCLALVNQKVLDI